MGRSLVVRSRGRSKRAVYEITVSATWNVVTPNANLPF